MHALRSEKYGISAHDGPDAQAGSGAAAAPHPGAPVGGWRVAQLDPDDPADSQLWLAPALHPRLREAAAAPAEAPDRAAPAPAGPCKAGLAGLFSLGRRPLPGHGADALPNGVRIETSRLILRVLALRDFDDYAAVAADPGTFRYSHRGPMRADDAWSRLLRQVGHWATLGWGLFALEEKATGRFVGEAGLGDFRRGIGEHFDGVPEAGWTIARWAQGQGYATEAMEAALGWIEQKLGTPRTVCMIHDDNSASLRVADKLGFRAFAECSYRGYHAQLFERIRL